MVPAVPRSRSSCVTPGLLLLSLPSSQNHGHPDRGPNNKDRSARTIWSGQPPGESPAIARPDTGPIPLDIFKIIIHCGLVSRSP